MHGGQLLQICYDDIINNYTTAHACIIIYTRTCVCINVLWWYELLFISTHDNYTFWAMRVNNYIYS